MAIVIAQTAFPFLDRLRRGRIELFERGLDGRQASPDLGPQFRRRRVDDLEVRFVRVVEEGKELVILPLAERVELVVVALTTADREAEPDAAGGVHAVNNRIDAELLQVDAALLVDHRVAMETGRGQLVRSRVRQQVAGELFDGETVKRHVGVEGIDHPVAIFPDRPAGVDGVAVRVGIAGGIKPVPGLHLAKVGRGERALHEGLVRPGGLVSQKLRNLRGGRRQAGEIELQSPNERDAVGLGRGARPFLLQAGEDLPVDFAARPGRVFHGGGDWFLDRLKRPMRGTHTGAGGGFRCGRPGRSLVDPAPQQRDLGGGQLALRRHLRHVVRPGDGMNQQTLRRLARHKSRAGIAALFDANVRVEAQSGFLLGRPVATDAMGGHQRLDVASVIDRRGQRRRGQQQEGGCEAKKSHGDRPGGEDGEQPPFYTSAGGDAMEE